MKNLFFALFIAVNFIFSSYIYSADVNSADYGAQGEVFINYTGGKNYTYTERTDLRRYDNGKYKGLVSREVRSFIVQADEDDSGIVYDGFFFVDEGTKRNSFSVFAEISDSIESSFKILNDGTLTMIKDNGYPTFRSFPSYPKKGITVGTKWQAKAVRSADPLNKGIPTKIPFYTEYTYLGEKVYNGEPVLLLSAKWATRYGSKFYIDYSGDKDLVEAQGSHSATIYISKKTGAAIVIRDSVDETFSYSNGQKISFKGTINMFTKYPPSLNHEKLLPVIQRVAQLSDEELEYLKSADGKSGSGGESFGHNSGSENSGGKPSKENPLSKNTGTDISVQKTELGIRLTIPNLQFKPDSNELLPTETKRLNQIAEILSQADDSMFLIDGHAAATGNKSGELKLSKERAAVIAAELSKRGIDASRFIVKASGSDKPIADNSTAEGKAKNRRVEITILE